MCPNRGPRSGRRCGPVFQLAMIIDCHTHLTGSEGTAQQRAARLLHYADIHGIDVVCVSMGARLVPQPAPQQIVEANDFVLEAIAYNPRRIVGFCYVSPAHIETSLAEMERCIAKGPMRGLKSWVCRRCSDPSMDPLCEYAAELDVPLLQHTWDKTVGQLEHESRPQDLAELAARHPQVKFLMAHCGGRWELGIDRVAHLPNVLLELGGTDPERGMTEKAVAAVGAERVVFGSDADGRSFATQLAKVQGAAIPPQDKRLILGQNAARLLRL